MIHKQLTLIGLALIVSGCMTPSQQPESGGPAAGNGSSSIVADTTSVARTLCSFVPTAETILALVATGRPDLTAAAGIAKAICDAVVPQPGAAPGQPTVAGVPIQGSFER